MQTSPRLLNKKTDVIPKDAVYIGRPSIWGNPYPLKTELDRDLVCDQFETYFYNNPELMQRAKKELKGKDLVCFCHPKRCHGETLLAYSNSTENMNKRIRIPRHPLEDGVTHINCYSKGRTSLGRALSHFSNIGFHYLDQGYFTSLESFWVWNATGRKHDFLKTLKGYEAKQAGKNLERIERPHFMDEIEDVVRIKILNHPELYAEFKESTLPLTHYYVVGTGASTLCIETETTPWFEYFYNLLREKEAGRILSKGLRTIVAGSRGIKDPEIVNDAIFDSKIHLLEIVSGRAPGVDRLAEKFANDRNIPLKKFPADWDSEPRRAGYIRNEEMAEYADACIAVWLDDSNGTAHMIDCMRKRNKTLFIVRISSDGNEH